MIRNLFLAWALTSLVLTAQAIAVCGFSAVSAESNVESLKELAQTKVSGCELPPGLDRFEIQVNKDKCPPLGEFGKTIKAALAKFEELFGPVDGKFKIEIGGKSFATGYSFRTDRINFVEKDDINGFGIESSDVVVHELFHQLLARKFPEIKASFLEKKSDKELEISMEALADYFAYTLNPDACFGEKFYKGKPCVRLFHSDLDYNLVQGSHERGNILASHLIETKTSFAEIRKSLETGDHSLAKLIPRNSLSRCPEAGSRKPVHIGDKGSSARSIGGTQVVEIEPNSTSTLNLAIDPQVLKGYPKAQLVLGKGTDFVGKRAPGLKAQIDATEKDNQKLRVESSGDTSGATTYKIQIESEGKVIGQTGLHLRVQTNRKSTNNPNNQ